MVSLSLLELRTVGSMGNWPEKPVLENQSVKPARQVQTRTQFRPQSEPRSFLRSRREGSEGGEVSKTQTSQERKEGTM